MAEPLTSSDILRERMGFGVSPLASQETRQSYAAAGLSPLSVMDRERFARGEGISSMASQQEKDAWKMAQFMAGQSEQAPVSYGGIGDRPVGSSRRAIRMQAEWDKRRGEEINRQRALQQMDIEQKQFEMSLRDQQMQENSFYYDRGLKEAEQKLKAEQLAQASNIVNGLNQLNPSSIEWKTQVAKIFGSNPLGAADQNVQKVASWYGDVNNAYIQSQRQSQEMQKTAIDAENNFISSGGSKEVLKEAKLKAITPDPTTGNTIFNPSVYASELEKQTAALKGAETQQEKVAKSPETRAAYLASEEARAERGKIRSSIRDIEDKIAAEEAVQASGIRGPKLKESQAALTRYQAQLQMRKAELEQYPAPAATPQTPTGQRPPLSGIWGSK